MDTKENSIGLNIRKIRKDMRLSRAKFAQELNVSESKVKNIEIGKTKPFNDIIDSICDRYELSHMEVFGYETSTAKQFEAYKTMAETRQAQDGKTIQDLNLQLKEKERIIASLNDTITSLKSLVAMYEKKDGKKR